MIKWAVCGKTHGKSYSRVYRLWDAMVQRCTNPNTRAYADYGLRGITVHNDWLRFEQFYADMGDPPAGLTLERKDNEDGYSKGNCVWATRAAQQRNRRTNIWFAFKGRRVLLSDVAVSEGIPLSTLYKRVNKAGMTIEDAVAHKLWAHTR